MNILITNALLLRAVIFNIFLVIEIFNIYVRALALEKICGSFRDLCRFNSTLVLGISVAAATRTLCQPLSQSIPDQPLFESMVRLLLDLSVIMTACNVSLSYLL